MTSPPAPVRAAVFIGTAGADWGVEGRMMAFDAATGKLAWTFYTIPTDRETGANTWKWIPSTLSRGGSTWSSYSLDGKRARCSFRWETPCRISHRAFVPATTSSPTRTLSFDARTGPSSGGIRPSARLADYDAAAATLLTKAEVNSSPLNGKDGYLQVVDRTTHRRLFKVAATRHLNDAVDPTLKGRDRDRNVFDVGYVGAVDWCGVFRLGESRHVAWLSAVDALSGRVLWKFDTPAPIFGGVTASAGGVVFPGDLSGAFYAFDAPTGKPLYPDTTANAITGGIASYASCGTQYVAVASGNRTKVTLQSSGTSTVTVYALDAKRPSVIDLRTAIPG